MEMNGMNRVLNVDDILGALGTCWGCACLHVGQGLHKSGFAGQRP